MSSKALKVVVCGPAKGGKTSIANLIAGHTEQLGNQNKLYDPTVGVRILECEKQPGISGGKIPVEIWDVSGDQSFESCWPAVMKDVDGVVIVYNPEIPTQETEVAVWYDHFVKSLELADEECQVFAHRTSPTPGPRSRPRETAYHCNNWMPSFGYSTRAWWMIDCETPRSDLFMCR